jgi:hypothetical protein
VTKNLSRAAMLALLVLLAPLHAAAQAPTDRWTFGVMPYLWLPSFDGRFNYGPPPPNQGTVRVDVDSSTLLDNLDFAFMIAGEARKGRWLVATDYIYLSFGKVDSDVASVDFNPGSGPINVGSTGLNSNTESSIKGTVWTLVTGYAAIQEPTVKLDTIGGFRYLNLEVRTDWQLSATVSSPGGGITLAQSGSVEKSNTNWAAIVGAKGQVKVGQSDWFVPYYFDIGGNADTFTWQGVAGIAYRFKWGDVRLDYRYLYYSMGGEGKLIDFVSFGGFALGANFVF